VLRDVEQGRSCLGSCGQIGLFMSPDFLRWRWVHEGEKKQQIDSHRRGSEQPWRWVKMNWDKAPPEQTFRVSPIVKSKD